MSGAQIVRVGLLACAGLCWPVRSQTRPPASTLLGRSAAPFDRVDLAGKHLSLNALRGKVVLLDFWATWCAPCLSEAPVFARWQHTLHASGLQVVSVAMDDDPVPVRALVGKLRLPYPVLMGDASLARSYGGVLGLPVTFLIDRRGLLRKRVDGDADLDSLHREVTALLAESLDSSGRSASGHGDAR